MKNMNKEICSNAKYILISVVIIFAIFSIVVILASIINIEPTNRPQQEINHNNYAEKK